MSTLPNEVKLRDFYDPETTRQNIFDNALNAYKARFPMKNEHVSIELDDIGYDPKRKLEYGIGDIHKAKNMGHTLSVPLKAKVHLKDHNGTTLDQKDVTLANVPYLTDYGTFIYGGTEYFTNNQSRLKPGVYARRKQNGELESHINPKAGSGPMMRLYMEPSTGIFRINVGQANIKLYPVLKNLGVQDQDLATLWGPDILKSNQSAFDNKAFSKFYLKLIGDRPLRQLKTAHLSEEEEVIWETQKVAEEEEIFTLKPVEPTDQEKAELIKQRLSTMQLDPEVTTRTLGAPHDRLSRQAILDASHKLLRISRNEDQEDDRDSLANRTFHSVEDFIKERIEKDSGKLGRALLYHARYDRSLKKMRPGYFTPQLESLIVGNQLSQAIPGLNPIEYYDQHKRVIQLGEGGVSSLDSIPDASRNVNLSQIGAIDPIRTTESMAVGIDQRFGSAVKKGDDHQIYMPLRNKKTGKIEYLNPTQIANKVIGFPKSRSLHGIDAAKAMGLK